jgi:hypothetical protein
LEPRGPYSGQVRGGSRPDRARWFVVRVVGLAAFAMLVGLLLDSGDSVAFKFVYGVTFLALIFVLHSAFHRWHRRHPPIDGDPNELHAPPNEHAIWPATRL